MTHDELILDRYEPLGVAGAGGFGTVQIAWDPRIQRKVAIKTIKLTALDAVRAALPGAQAVAEERWHGAEPWDEFLAREAADEADAPDAPEAPDAPPGEASGGGAGDQVTSLAHIPGLDEARTAAMLADQRIVTVYDFEVRGRTAYLIMEYVEGITLTRLLADYPEFITLDMAAAVFDAVAGALVAAHDAGVLHLDIKPDNILITPQGQVKVTDFGLATLADASGAGTTGGGTIGYMPLEQMRREHLDARADEWSLASVAYEMLTGENPFRARDLDGAEKAIEDAELVLPSLCWEHLDEQADDVVFYALDPDRDQRYASVADFAEELDKFLGDAREGAEQLALVVQDALGMGGEDEAPEGGEAPGEEGLSAKRPARPRVLDRLLVLLGPQAPDASQPVEGDGEEAFAYEDREEGAVREPRASRASREPLAERFSPRTLSAAARVLAACASGLVALLALSNVQALSAGFGPGAPYVRGLGAVVVAVVGAVAPSVGALVAYCLLGIAVILCGHPVVGTVLLVATVVWWYVAGHGGKAAANVALLGSALGAVGGASAAPFFAGAALDPVRATVTCAYCAVVAFVLGSLGSGSLLGWDALAHGSFAGVDVAAGALAMVTRSATWATAAGWIVASGALSLCRSRDSRWLDLVGVALALVAVLVGSLVFASPTPQLIVAAALAAAAVIAAVM